MSSTLDYYQISLSSLKEDAGLELHLNPHTNKINSVKINKHYYLRHPDLSDSEVNKIASKLLHEPLLEKLTFGTEVNSSKAKQIHIAFKPGVTDREAFELKTALAQLGFADAQVARSTTYLLEGDISADALEQLAKQLTNPVTEDYSLEAIEPTFLSGQEIRSGSSSFDISAMDDEALLALSNSNKLALNLSEMQAVRDYAKKEGRQLSEAELEMVAQTWSEHCYHKTFRANISFTEIANGESKTQDIDGLLKSYIKKATDECQKDWLISVFVDNAGIIDFDGEYVLSFKAETHNHPSALEPFGGANTGVGGVIRDIMGVSARPIAVTDVLCFAPSDLPADALPEGSLDPVTIAAGVVAGIGDYGNKMGIPTVNGSIHYHPDYAANPLVYCGCVGLAKHDTHVTSPQVGDHIIVLGGATGRDGLKGATFSSLDLDSDTNEAEFASTAVQIGDPIVEKDVMEVVLVAAEAKLYNAITDCGAGGLSSAVGEMAEELGARVELEKVSLKYSGLLPWEVWLSEAQERMVLSVSADKLPELQKLCDLYGVLLDDIGTMTGTGIMEVYFDGQSIVGLDMSFLHDGHPKLQLEAEWHVPTPDTSDVELPVASLKPLILKMLADPNVASKADVIHQYDHEVLGSTVVKPLTGYRNHGPSDAAVIKPQFCKSEKAFALAHGINPHYGELDSYAMAISAIDEAVRNAVCAGANPKHMAILDNFCWGNPQLKDRLGSLVKASQACYDGARAFDLPYISGKDSLNNEFVSKNGERKAIPPTLLVSSIGVLDNYIHATTMDLKEVGNPVYLVGQTKCELGASVLARHLKDIKNTVVPQHAEESPQAALAIHSAISQGTVRACHDLSDGGLALAAAEMALAGGLGLNIDLGKLDNPENLTVTSLLFSESNGRYLVEVDAAKQAEFENCFENLALAKVGTVQDLKSLVVMQGKQSGSSLSIAIDDLEAAFCRQELAL